MKKIYKLFISAAVICCPISLTISSCSDTWDEHFDEGAQPSDLTLLDLVERDEELSDFLEVLRATHVYNNNRPTSVTYADLLGKDQSLTVWAPKNGTFNRDSLLDICQTQRGDSIIGQQFVANHIARTTFDSNETKGSQIIMFNSKKTNGKNFNLENAQLNIPAKNGILHIINNEIPYSYSIYEAITSLNQFHNFGTIFRDHESQELDENASVPCGIEDGQIVYSDSVMIKTNIFYSAFGRINDEDSSYFAILPYENDWDIAYNEALQYYNYGSLENADSLRELYSNVGLMEPLFYNRNLQKHMQDSIFSTSYYSAEPEYNVFYNPLDEGGILSPTYIAETMECSNGEIFMLKQWPFTPLQTFYRPITTEVEYNSYLISSRSCSLDYRDCLADSVSNHGYVAITASSNWSLSYRIYGNLSAEYDVCVVVLPRTVSEPSTNDHRKNKFNVSVKYPDLDGRAITKSYNNIENNPYKVDTIKIARIAFPVCTYGNRESSVSITINCNVPTGTAGAKYTRNMLLDCIYLKPVEKKEDAE